MRSDFSVTGERRSEMSASGPLRPRPCPAGAAGFGGTAATPRMRHALPGETDSLEIVQRLTLYERAISPSVSLSALTRLIASRCWLVGREGWLPAEPNTVRDGAHPAVAGECR